jgi:MobA/MobL family
MAVYYVNASTGSRDGGQSAAAKFNYVTRTGRYTERTVTRADGWGTTLPDAQEVAESVSENMPQWASKDARLYWRAADKFERGNGRLFKSLIIALPAELSDKGQRDLALKIARQLTRDVDGGNLPFTLAIHRGKGINPHFHLIISERVNDGIERTRTTWFSRAATSPRQRDNKTGQLKPPKQEIDPRKGGARKTDKLKPGEWLDELREEWTRLANRALEAIRSAARIDHRRQLETKAKTLAKLELIEKERQQLEAAERVLQGRLERMTNPGEYLARKVLKEQPFKITPEEGRFLLKKLGAKHGLPDLAVNVASLEVCRLEPERDADGQKTGDYILTPRPGEGEKLAKLLRREPKVKQQQEIEPRTRTKSRPGLGR